MPARSLTTLTLAVTLAVAIGGSAPSADDTAAPLVITHGISSGDVTPTSAIIWARASGPAQLHVEVDTNAAFPRPKSRGSATASAASDFTAQLTLEKLQPDTRYWYRVWLSGAGGHGRSRVSDSMVGTFKTAPSAEDRRPVSFVLGADVGGQQFCRRAATNGYAIVGELETLHPDDANANGDSIYADGDCPAQGPLFDLKLFPGDRPTPAEIAQGNRWLNIPGDFPSISDPAVDWTNIDAVRDVYLKHWRYNRNDPYSQQLLRTTPVYAQWDDHEVINDFGARWTYFNSATIARNGYPNLPAAGLETFFAYTPTTRNSVDPERVYRSFRWGKDLEVFFLDARSYRDRNDLPDTPENDKVMLGKEQVAWLVEGIRSSTATWKVVSSDVPISIPTGSLAFGRDAWANIGAEPSGFERELLQMLGELDKINAENVVFVATDVHYATTIKYDVDADHDGDRLAFHEVVAGPLNAVRNPAKTTAELDPAANPAVIYAEGRLFNFAYVSIGEQLLDHKVHFVADVRGADGVPRPGSRLDLTPR